MGANRIMSDQFRFDMAGWLSEKSENTLERAIEILKLVRGQDTESRLTLEIEELTYDLLFDLTKIFSFSKGTEWEIGDCDIISEDPKHGMEKLKKKYGLIESTTEESQKIRVSTFIMKARALMGGPRSRNRTTLHDLVREYGLLGSTIGQIEDDLYLVTNGEKSWEDFVVETEQRLQLMESKLS